MENKTEDAQKDGASDTDMHSAEAAASETRAAAAFIAPVFDISAGSTRCPVHRALDCK